MSIEHDQIQGGLLALLGTVIAGLLGWRGYTAVKTDNARANRESRLEEGLQRRYEAAQETIERLQRDLVAAREGRAVLEHEQRELVRQVRNLLEMLDPQARRVAQRWVEQSGFGRLDSGGDREGWR